MISFSINGKTFSIGSGKNIQVQNGRVIVDGKVLEDTGEKNLHVSVEGELVGLQADGSVNCDNVQGNVDAGGSVDCGHVTGNVDAGGSVNCGSVDGNVDAGGSVNCQKSDAELKYALKQAVGFLKDAKDKFAPSTTNSLVDDFIARWDR